MNDIQKFEKRLSKTFSDKQVNFQKPVYYIEWSGKVFRNTSKSNKWTYRSPKTAHNALVEHLFNVYIFEGDCYLTASKIDKLVTQYEQEGKIVYKQLPQIV